MAGRAAFHVAVYAALLCAVAGLSAWRGVALDAASTAGAVALGAGVAGALVALIEERAPSSSRPLLMAAALGALAYLALCGAVTVCAGATVDAALLAVGAAFGAVVHVSRLARARSDEGEPSADGDEADTAAPWR